MKRILLYRFDRPPLEALVQPQQYVHDQKLSLMTTAGSIQEIPLADVKAVCFASEPGRPDLFTTNNLFERRPKLAGLWARFTFKDRDQLEGVLEHNLLDWPTDGFLLTPPNANSTRQRVFVPRAALVKTELLGTIGKSAAAGVAHRRPARASAAQMPMFD